MIEAGDWDQTLSKRKAIYALSPYAIFLARGGRLTMFDAVSSALRPLYQVGCTWEPVRPYIASLFDEPSHLSLNRVITLISPYAPWEYWRDNENRVARWISAVMTVPYTEEIGQSVVDALLQIAATGKLRPHITTDVWAWLKKPQSLPPACRGRYIGTTGSIVRHIRGLGDIEILKSYFLLVWSEWDRLLESCFNEMATSIREDFGGIGMFRHRRDLTERLSGILGQLDQGLEYIRRRKPTLDEDNIRVGRERYAKLKEVLLEVDRKAVETSTRMYLKLICSRKNNDPHGRGQNLTQPSPALCLFRVRNLALGAARLFLGFVQQVFSRRSPPYTFPFKQLLSCRQSEMPRRGTSWQGGLVQAFGLFVGYHSGVDTTGGNVTA